jgi:hypothetical protein
MSRIFISYRHEDTAADMTDRIYERLKRRWGRRVFMDIDSLVGGDVFARAIEDNLNTCAVVLVIIGRAWLRVQTEHGTHCIDDAGDYPRMEVAAALRRGVRVIPVLVGAAEMPKREELPDDLRTLVDRQFVRVTRERFDADMRRLVDAVASELPAARWSAPWRIVSIAALFVAFAVMAYLLLIRADRAVRLAAASGKQQPVRMSSNQSDLPRASGDAQDTVSDISGKWHTAFTKNPYDDDRYKLLFEFIQQGTAVFGHVTEVPQTAGRNFTRRIIDGKINKNVVTFYTAGEVWDGDKREPYKEYYTGIIDRNKNVIAFERLNDVSSGGEVERIAANRE